MVDMYFENAIVDALIERFPEAKVDVREVTKTNGIKTGISILDGSTTMAPTVYLEDFCKMYEDGTAIDDIIDKIVDIISNSKTPSFDVNAFADYESVRDTLRARVVSLTANAKMQKERPSRVIAGDLLVTYYSVIKGFEGASIPVTNEVAENWGVDEATLYEQAVVNMESETDFKNMAVIMAEMMGREEEVDESEYAPMYVLTNKQKLNGAGQLVLTGVLDNIRAEIGDFYIIPSSIHECIILPQSLVDDPNVLNGMIGEVNESSAVEADEILGTHVYVYDGELRSNDADIAA